MTSLRRGVFVAVLGALGALAALTPGLAAAASISGTVTDDSPGHAGIVGIEVCAQPQPYEFEESCTQTAAGGTYSLAGLKSASYHLHFSSARNRLNYVSEFYDDKLAYPGDLLAVPGDVSGVDAELQIGGRIKGVAKDSATGGAAVGAEVCASSYSPVEYFGCGLTGSDGSYEINALPSAEYAVSFFGGSEANYLHRYYDESDTPTGERVSVLAGGPAVEGIDATLQPGAQILGTVTDAAGAAPGERIEVCLYDTLRAPEVGFREPCVLTDSAGHYAIRSLRQGIYDVVFSHDQPLAPNDLFFEQWYDGVPTLAQATPIAIAPPEARSGVDARLTHYPVDPPRGPDPVKVSLLPILNAKPKPLHCRKGFQKRRVKGKARCVRKQRKHRPGRAVHG